MRNLTPLEDEKKSPEELWTRRPQKISHLRVFRCVAYAHIPAARRAKLQPTAVKGIFVGYALTERQYRILDPETMFVKLHTSVEFDESQKGGQFLPEAQRRRAPLERTEDAAIDEDEILSNIDVCHPPVMGADESDEPQAAEEQSGPERAPESVEQDTEPARRPERVLRPQRTRKQPRRFEDGTATALQVDTRPAVETTTPRTFEEATQSKQSRE